MTKQRRWITIRIVLMCLFFIAPSALSAQELQTGSGALITRVAPGESLPLAVRLSNFGSNQRVDISIRYEIFDAKELLVVSQTETVAVETSASYIKQIALPSTLPPGLYTARTSIIYNGQKVPATASEQFTVEQKIYGIFMSDLITDGAVLFAVALVFVLLGLLFRRYRRESLFKPQDYSNVPENMRVYYEMLGDAIQQMRYHEGDAAIEVAKKIPGLTIDSTNGKVLAISNDPSEVIAAVVSHYEKAFGKKLNLSFVSKEKSHAIVR